MKWFKHLSTSLKDSFVFELIENFDGDGYLVFFGTLEMMADEYDIENPGVLTVSLKKMTSFFQLSRQKTVKILRFCDQKAKDNPEKSISFFAEIKKNHVVITCSKMADLCDNHTATITRNATKPLRSENEVTFPKEVEEDKEVEEESLKSIKKKCPSGKIIDLYNEILGGKSLPKVMVKSDTLKKQIKARWEEYSNMQSLESWEWYFEFVRQDCPFLLGVNNQEWVSNLIWLVGRNNMTKVLNNNYLDTRGIKRHNEPDETF